ncbi:hypothetical protein [Psychrobacter sp. UBA3480]|uniref:hypothetical protein n=1 Tax=Psychrobacter sp. UBA3480 TaxID=1947350 RepID=UPI0025D2CFBB|nr:hypothetical protein [Psychrobacter sp. UBA3480]
MKDKFQEAMAKNVSLKIQMSDMRAKHISCLDHLKTLMEAEHAGAHTDPETEILARNLKIIKLKKITAKMERKVTWHQRVVFLWQIKIILAVAVNAYIMVPIMLFKGLMQDSMLLTFLMVLIFIIIGTVPVILIIGNLLAIWADNLDKSLDNEFREFLKIHNA